MVDTRRRAAPAYTRIAEELRQRIAALRPHEALPSERELSEEFGVSRMTARHAVMVLEDEGTVYRRFSQGTFVAEPRVRFQIGSFTEQIDRLGRKPHAELLDAVTRPATADEANQLGLEAGSAVHALCRLRLADTEPLAIERTILPATLTPGLLESPLDGSIWSLMHERFGVTPSEASARFECQPLDAEASALLKVRVGAAGIVLTRRTVDSEDRPIEFAIDTYRADRTAFEFSQSLTDVPRNRL